MLSLCYNYFLITSIYQASKTCTILSILEMKTWGLEALNDFSKITRIISNRTGVQSQAIWPSS